MPSNFRESVCLSPLIGSAKREANEWSGGLIAQPTGERFTLSLGERAGVRASVELTYPCTTRRELEKKSGRKVVTSENYLVLAQSVKKTNRLKV